MGYRGDRGWRIARESPLTWPSAAVGVFLLAVGLFILGWWGNFVLAGNMPQGIFTVEKGSYLALHVGAEALTALVAVAGGIGLLRGRLWGVTLGLVSLGGLLYAAINSLAFSLLSAPERTPVFLGVLGAVLLSFIGLHFGRR